MEVDSYTTSDVTLFLKMENKVKSTKFYIYIQNFRFAHISMQNQLFVSNSIGKTSAFKYQFP